MLKQTVCRWSLLVHAAIFVGALVVVLLGSVTTCPTTLAADDDSKATPGAKDLGARGSTAASARLGKRAPVVHRDLSLERSAMRRGLDYLKGQQKTSGAVGGEFPVAVTSLAGLAFLGYGSSYSRGPFAVEIRKCLDYVIGSADRDGFLSEKKPESKMHGHGMALLFLTQVFGDLPADRQREVAGVIQRGIKCIRRGKSWRGGWTYHWDNKENDDEASVTIGVVQALRAADNIGFRVESSLIEAAIKYVKKSQTSDGSFQYSLNPVRGGQGSQTTFALTAAAVSTLNAAGVYESVELRRGFDFMEKELSRVRGKPKSAIQDPFFYYGALYASQAYFQRGGRAWSEWYTEMRSFLLRKQKSDGRWVDQAYGDEFGTAVGALILAMPIQYLPIFQR